MAVTDAPNTQLQLVASYGDYDEAQEAVDLLADRRFPVERLTIVAGDIAFVERITGRLGYGGAAANGAGAGAVAGALLGFFFGLFDWVTPIISGLALALWGALIGLAIGALVGLAGHALTAGRRDYSSVGGLQAGRYDLMATTDVADEARRLLADGRRG